jgi:tRNA A37 methylthiotransferase MiaB
MGLKNGQNAIRLVSGDVGAYGLDIGTNIAELLKEIFKEKAQFDLMWADFNPRWFIKYFDDIFRTLSENSDRIGYLGFPMQTGSERIIKLMDRGHTVDDAKRCLLELQNTVPKIRKSTHILVGFPGETDNDFNDTIQFLKEVRFDHLSLYKYDDRPETKASEMPNKVAESIKYQRMHQLAKGFRNVCHICN